MKSSEIIRIVKREIAKGEDVTYFDIAHSLAVSSGGAGLNESADFIRLFLNGKVSKSSLYTKVRKRIATLVRQGHLEIEKDGKQVLVTLPYNRIIPAWDIIRNHMITEYPEWFSVRDGGTNKGGGYSYILRKFYEEVEDFLN